MAAPSQIRLRRITVRVTLTFTNEDIAHQFDESALPGANHLLYSEAVQDCRRYPLPIIHPSANPTNSGRQSSRFRVLISC